MNKQNPVGRRKMLHEPVQITRTVERKTVRSFKNLATALGVTQSEALRWLGEQIDHGELQSAINNYHNEQTQNPATSAPASTHFLETQE